MKIALRGNAVLAVLMLPALVLLGVLLGIAAPGLAQSRSDEAKTLTVTGMTRPSEERKLSFSGPGVVAKAPVKEGDRVKAGDMVLSLDDVIDQKELERLQVQSNSSARVEAAEADLAVKKAVLKREREANAKGESAAFGEAEMEQAEADVTLREKQLIVAKEDLIEAKIKAAQQEEKVRKLHILSPIDGLVQRIVVNVGEWADPQSREGVVMVVKNDPVYVEVRELPAKLVGMLQMGQKLQVRYPDQADKPENWQEAEVFFFSPVAESVQTRLFKLRLSNPDGRPAGLEVVVKLPADVANAANQPADKMAGNGS